MFKLAAVLVAAGGVFWAGWLTVATVEPNKQTAQRVGAVAVALLFAGVLWSLFSGAWYWVALGVLLWVVALALPMVARDVVRSAMGEQVTARQYADGPYLDEIRFRYVDRDGNASSRWVQVCAVDDEYFEGQCLERMAQRTFVIGRVRGKVTSSMTGEVLSPKDWAASMRRHPGNTGLIEMS